MTQLDAARFQQADKYLSYLGTTEGKLRLDLAWNHLRPFLPALVSSSRAIDVGSGTGALALRLAQLGFDVDLIDSSAPMLSIARGQAVAQELAHRTTFHLGDAASLSELFASPSFDVVVCHNLLEYVEDPSSLLRSMVAVLKKDNQAVISVLVRNRWGEVLKAAIKNNDQKLVKEAMSAETVHESLYGQPVRLFDPAGLLTMLEQAGLKVIAERGLRVASDYSQRAIVTEGDYNQLLEIEMSLCSQPQLATVARYTQIIAQPLL